MAYWNYRIVHIVDQGEDVFAITEVHYNDDGSISGYAEDPNLPIAATMEELGEDLLHMLAAFAKTVIESIELVQGAEVTSS